MMARALYALAAAAKRVRNILSQAGSKGIDFASGTVDAGLLREAAERDLHEQMGEVDRSAAEKAARDDHGGALSAIATIRPAEQGAPVPEKLVGSVKGRGI